MSELADWYVQILERDTDRVEKTMGPMTLAKAEKIDNGVNINLNHETFWTHICRAQGLWK